MKALKQYLIRAVLNSSATLEEVKVRTFQTGSLEEARNWVDSLDDADEYEVWEKDLNNPILL